MCSQCEPHTHVMQDFEFWLVHVLDALLNWFSGTFPLHSCQTDIATAGKTKKSKKMVFWTKESNISEDWMNVTVCLSVELIVLKGR